jgi:hypothetical protein
VVNRVNNLDSTLWVTLSSIIIALSSIALSLPVVWLLDKFTPQLVGKPFQAGPLLPGLDKTFVPVKEKIKSLKF